MIARLETKRSTDALPFALLFLSCPFLAPFLEADDRKSTAFNYEDQIKPILRWYCVKCHGDDTQEAGINMQNYGTLVREGSGGKIVEAGRASQSLLMQLITDEDADARTSTRPHGVLSSGRVHLASSERRSCQWPTPVL